MASFEVEVRGTTSSNLENQIAAQPRPLYINGPCLRPDTLETKDECPTLWRCGKGVHKFSNCSEKGSLSLMVALHHFPPENMTRVGGTLEEPGRRLG